MIEKEQSFQISGTESGARLDQLLHARFPQFSRSDWQERIKDGRVVVEGARTRSSKRVREGETVTFRYNQKPEPEVDSGYRIVHRDENVIVIDKPANLPVHPSGIYHKHTLTSLMQRDLGIKPHL